MRALSWGLVAVTILVSIAGAYPIVASVVHSYLSEDDHFGWHDPPSRRMRNIAGYRADE